MNDKQILYLFTRTPLHVGAGASVGAIDQPIIRERHTGFPIIPASSLKGTFADEWNGDLLDDPDSGGKRVRVRKDGTSSVAGWLFGSDSNDHPASGALQFTEARLLAFPIRSAKGSFAWITCPLMLQRAVRDGVLQEALLKNLQEPGDTQAIFDSGGASKIAFTNQIVLEEYTFGSAPWLGLNTLGTALAAFLPQDLIWQEIKDRMVIVSNGMMSYFAHNACEVAQHVRINDETGTATDGALFNQENVPSETFFYARIHAFNERRPRAAESRNASEALAEFKKKVDGHSFQFGGDASTGLGYCTVRID